MLGFQYHEKLFPNHIRLKNLKMSEAIRKVYDLKEGTVEGNTIKGVASVTGIIDRGRDLMFPGCYKGILSEFLKEGFAARGHDWGADPIIMPTKAQEVGQNLKVEGEYHTTSDAQNNKTVVTERLEKGLFVGLSVGFLPDYSKIIYFEDGAKLLNFAEKNGYDLDLMDVKGIKNEKRGIRGIPTVKKLFEWSVVTVPMNQLSSVSEVRNFGGTALSFLDDLDPAQLSEDQRKGLEAMKLSIDNLLGFSPKSEQDPTPEEDGSDQKSRYVELRSRTAGLKNRTWN